MANNRQVQQPQQAGPVTPEMVDTMMLELYGRVGGLSENPRMSEMLRSQLLQTMESGDEAQTNKLLKKYKGLGLSASDIQRLIQPQQQPQGQGQGADLNTLLQLFGGK